MTPRKKKRLVGLWISSAARSYKHRMTKIDLVNKAKRALREYEHDEENPLYAPENLLKTIFTKRFVGQVKLAKSIYSIVKDYEAYYVENFPLMWNDYFVYSKKLKISVYDLVHTFNIAQFSEQNSLYEEELQNVYNYLFKCCKLKSLSSNDEINFKYAILSNCNINGCNTKIRHIQLNKNLDFTKSTLKSDDALFVDAINDFKNIEELLKDVPKYTFKNNIIDIDQRNGINLFVENRKIGIYKKDFDANLINDGFDRKILFREIPFISDNEYIRFIHKVLLEFPFKYFNLS